jgi:hypothetical protein
MGDEWNQYELLCDKASVALAQRYVSRRKTFTDDIQQCMGNAASFVQP